MHDPVPEQGAYLRSVVGGHTRYYGVPMNGPSLTVFRKEIGRLWMKALMRRSQKHRLTWDRMKRLIDRWLPPAQCSFILILLFVCASLPEARTVCGKTARTDLCGGCRATGIPTAIAPGGGYMLTCGTADLTEARPENLRAMIDAAKEYGVYRK